MTEIAAPPAAQAGFRARRFSPRFFLSGWLAAAFVIAALAAAPVASLVWLAMGGDASVWREVAPHVVAPALRETALLLFGVALIVIPVGTITAWLVTAYDFKGRAALTWMLLLPLATPTYVAAFAYVDILHAVGPFQTALRALLGYSRPADLRLPDIRSLPGAALLLGFVLYPYVYLATRALFLSQPASMLDVARSLGAGDIRVFARIALPMARPAVAAGCALALMEALNDVGAATFLGVRTLTVTVQAVWLNQSNLPGAAQIALMLLLMVVSLTLVERAARRRAAYAAASNNIRLLTPRRLSGAPAVLALLAGLLPVCLGFLFPFLHLVHESLRRLSFAGLSASLIDEMLTTLALSAFATVLAVAAGVVVAFAGRAKPGAAATFAARAASLGYALPGSILAIGMLPLAFAFSGASVGLLGWSAGVLASAYAIRFLAIPVGAVEAGLARVPRDLDDVASSLGESSAGVLARVVLPITLPSVAAAATLVFVECMKELPITLMLRPLNVETLATHLYGEAARGSYEDGAIAALLIVLVSLAPVILLSRLTRSFPGPASLSVIRRRFRSTTNG